MTAGRGRTHDPDRQPAPGQLAAALAGYDALFTAAGLGPSEVRAIADNGRAALLDWAPDLAAEIDRRAELAGVAGWRLHALNARTEVLAAAGFPGRDCSTLAGPGLGGQTWDWHAELAGCWQVRSEPAAGLGLITLTEAGILAKIGMNSAGVGLLFNILGHRSDTGRGGVPVHAVARRVLDSALDVDTALAIISDVPLAASSCFTVLDERQAVCVEASSAGVRVLPASGRGWLVHTNHFLDPELAAGDLRTGPEYDTEPRLALLRQRLADERPDRGGAAPEQRLRRLLCAHQQDGAPVCCHPPATGALGTRWQTLATVVLRPAERSMAVLAGGPCTSSDWSSWRLPPEQSTHAQ